VGHCQIRVEADGSFKILSRFLIVTRLSQGRPQIVIGIGVVRINSDSLSITFSSLFALSFILISSAETTVSLGEVRLDAIAFWYASIASR